ncbi:hypothetical protein GCM10010211_74580 [Streptomyces albospinus]|uniref:Uncharacterized protein n=1 Tax=Streptomyces albospinus TaxID=285515 RepID=A0ABQ2VN62_9ACTN|nr:hypothetical protein GCM10010211_74580 [Streptomyces albospinus]
MSGRRTAARAGPTAFPGSLERRQEERFGSLGWRCTAGRRTADGTRPARGAAGQARPHADPADISGRLGEFAESGLRDPDRAVDVAVDALTARRAVEPIRRAEHLAAMARQPDDQGAEFVAAVTPRQGRPPSRPS